MSITSEEEWAERAAAFLKHKLRETEITYVDLAKKLKKHGFKGETEASIRSEQEGDRLHQVALFGGAALFLEFGTVYMPPFPYIIPATDITRPKWIDMWLSLEAYLR